MKETITIHLCENDDRGNVMGKCQAISFEVGSVSALYIEPKTGGYEDVLTTPRSIEMYGVKIRTFARGEWAGNMKWNSYETLPAFALGLINMLMNSGKWQVNEAWIVIDSKWLMRQEITYQDFLLSQPVQPEIINPNQTELKL